MKRESLKKEYPRCLQGYPARAKMLREILFLELARQTLGAPAAVALGDQAVAKPGSRTWLSLHGIYVLEHLVPRWWHCSGRLRNLLDMEPTSQIRVLRSGLKDYRCLWLRLVSQVLCWHHTTSSCCMLLLSWSYPASCNFYHNGLHLFTPLVRITLLPRKFFLSDILLQQCEKWLMHLHSSSSLMLKWGTPHREGFQLTLTQFLLFILFFHLFYNDRNPSPVSSVISWIRSWHYLIRNSCLLIVQVPIYLTLVPSWSFICVPQTQHLVLDFPVLSVSVYFWIFPFSHILNHPCLWAES